MGRRAGRRPRRSKREPPTRSRFRQDMTRRPRPCGRGRPECAESASATSAVVHRRGGGLLAHGRPRGSSPVEGGPAVRRRRTSGSRTTRVCFPQWCGLDEDPWSPWVTVGCSRRRTRVGVASGELPGLIRAALRPAGSRWLPRDWLAFAQGPRRGGCRCASISRVERHAGRPPSASSSHDLRLGRRSARSVRPACSLEIALAPVRSPLEGSMRCGRPSASSSSPWPCRQVRRRRARPPLWVLRVTRSPASPPGPPRGAAPRDARPQPTTSRSVADLQRGYRSTLRDTAAVSRETAAAHQAAGLVGPRPPGREHLRSRIGGSTEPEETRTPSGHPPPPASRRLGVLVDGRTTRTSDPRRSPTVPRGTSRLRLTVRADLDPEILPAIADAVRTALHP